MGNASSRSGENTASPSLSKKEIRCHYEVLQVSQEASPDELKRAYRQRALLLHPDKNPHRVAEATAEFAEVQRAYEVLSDPQERAWYDRHRESILRKNSINRNAEDLPTVEDLMVYFSTTAYDGYEDGPQGFFTVYRELFEEIEQFELEVEYASGEIDPLNGTTSFGSKNTPFEPSLAAFYDKWLHFTSSQTFEHIEKYSTEYGENRRMRRAMEKENSRLREQMRREFSETVRSLAQFVRKRDPRYKAYLRVKTSERERKERNRREEQRIQRERDSITYVEPDWAKHELDDLTKAASEYFEDYDHVKGDEDDALVQDGDGNNPSNSGDSDGEGEIEEFYCAPCRKLFRSQRQWKNHEQSRKHRDTLRKMGIDPDEVMDEEADDHQPENFEFEKEEENSSAEDPASLLKDLDITEAHQEQNPDDESTIHEPTINACADADPIHPSNATKKRKARRSIKSTSNNNNNNINDDSDELQYKCTVCREAFDSRNKLFSHIRVEGHAQAPTGKSDNTSSRKRNSKKRT